MSIPTSGTYPGIDIYQIVATASTPADFQSALADLAPYLDGTGYAIPTSFIAPVATSADVSFNGSSVSFDADGGQATTLDDSTVYASGETGFGFVSDGTQYVLSNGALPDDVTANQALAYLTSYFTSAGNTGGLAAVQAVQSAIANDPSLGDYSFLTNGGIFDGQPYQPPCFARGTLIATPSGERPVESLEEGDLVRLARGGGAAVRWVGRRRLKLDGAARPELQRPIRIVAGALGGGLPTRDLVVSPDHALFLDGVLVPAGLLVDGARIRQEDVETIEYFHVELASHDVILAEGAPAESYLDTGNRDTFANAPLVALRPDLSAGAERIGTACAEMVLGGERLDRIRAALASVSPDARRQAS